MNHNHAKVVSRIWSCTQASPIDSITDQTYTSITKKPNMPPCCSKNQRPNQEIDILHQSFPPSYMVSENTVVSFFPYTKNNRTPQCLPDLIHTKRFANIQMNPKEILRNYMQRLKWENFKLRDYNTIGCHLYLLTCC